LLWDLVCSEREPKALAVVSKREPEPGAVGEPEGFCLKAATVGVENHPDLGKHSTGFYWRNRRWEKERGETRA
jgi:hypothetical protein